MATLEQKLRAGEPVELALKSTTARYVAGMYGPQSMFTTSRGKLYLDPEPASDIETQVRDSAIAPGEKIRVMRMRKPDGGYGWEVRRIGATIIEATIEEQLVKSLEAQERKRQAAESPETASPVTETNVAETNAAGAEAVEAEAVEVKAAEVKADEAKATATNGSSSNGTSGCANHSAAAPFTANQGNSQQHSGNTPPVIAPGTLKLMACFKQAIDAVAEAQVYCGRKRLGITFTSEDVRATAITCYINCIREGR